jgi:hypothetical protein
MMRRGGVDRRLMLGGCLAMVGCAAGSGTAARPSAGADDAPREGVARLVARYPDHLSGFDDVSVTWRDGTRMPTGAGRPPRPFAEMLRDATIADQLRQAYEPGPLPAPPPRDHSPGRLRHTPFFVKMYGDCRAGGTASRLRPVRWMPRSAPQTVPVTTVNDVAGRLERVIDALEGMPDRLKAYLVPSAGAFNCRVVADTGLPSMHSFGAAIDIALRFSDYWVWARPRGGLSHRNRIPPEIVEAFEAERFIWGGKWYHFDTMHFEYRPELFA